MKGDGPGASTALEGKKTGMQPWGSQVTIPQRQEVSSTEGTTLCSEDNFDMVSIMDFQMQGSWVEN